MQRKVTGALVAVVAAILAAACGGSESGGSAQITAPGCPAGAPPPAPLSRSAGPGGLIKPNPVVVAICQYRSGRPGRPPLRRIVLRARAASGLAAVVNSGGPVTASTRRCDRPDQLLPYSQVFAFRYPTGRVSRVEASQLSCDRAVVTTHGRSGVLGFDVAAGLFGITMAPRHPRGPRTPSLIGLTAAGAAAAAKRHHFSTYFDGGVIDQTAPFGAVVFQSLPAGLRATAPGREVDVIIAVRESPRCAADQLSLSYLGGEAGAGNDFGTLLVSDRSSRACTLSGPLRVTGLSRVGQPVTNTVRFALAGVAVLSPGVATISRDSPGGKLIGLAPGDLTGSILLQAEYRDGPANVDNGLCTPLWVVPASWRVTLPDSKSLVVANVDRHNRGLVRSGGFVTCRGKLGSVSPATVTYLGN